ncbi:esterase E4-like [Eupeodes corollae]|uniref:esterase E4-like n=1 Tax=Eupeodes corollae TaxID=290404 RepID=UPI002490162F|nr:esterase E4-like [Eupeodes corollae]
MLRSHSRMESFLLVNLLFILSCCGFGLVSGQNRPNWPPIVETNLGTIRGFIMRTDKGSPFIAFRGIRYAEAPIGEKRFKAPIAIKSWAGELDATQDGFMCPQTGKPAHLISEDCLFLNVYSKNTTTTVNRPVIVYLHGGANVYGGSHSLEAGPEYLMESDIVLVTMNFRLGAFGYLSTRTKEAPGNFGYLDQLMALQWVHDHISRFGGNPHSVTIIGMSAGAMAVTLHMASPLSQGLFHRAVAMSGSATSEHLIDNLYWAQKLAHQTSCPRFNAVDMLECLRKLPWEQIVSVCDSWQFYNLLDMKWNYEVDGYFLKKRPAELFAEGNFSKIPILTGITKDEFTFMISSQENNTGFLNDVSLNFEKYAQEFFMHNFTDNNPKAKKAEKVRNFYLGNKTIAEQNLSNFGEIFSDTLISHGVHRLVELARKWVDVYYYRFDFQGNSGAYTNWQGKPRGVNHGDDLQYFMKRQKLKRHINQNDSEWFMVERMVGLVSSFAEDGSPQNIDGIKWLPSNKFAVNTMYIDEKVTLGSEPYADRFHLWDTLYPLSKSGNSALSSGISLMVALIFLCQFF